MADNKNPTADEPKAKRASSSTGDDRASRRYSHEQLIQDAPGYLGVPPHVAAGALAEEKREELTVAEAKKRVAGWLGQ